MLDSVASGLWQMPRMLILGVVVVAACTSVPENGRAVAGPSAEPRPAVIYTLLGNGRLLVASAQDGAILADLVLATSPLVERTYRHVMGLSPDGQTVYVLVQDVGLRAAIYAVDASNYRVLRTLDLETGPAYRGIAVGARSGSLFAFGNEDGAAAVWLIDPAGTHPVRKMPARSPEGGPWSVYQGALSADETLVFLSYHGPTTGIDRFELRDQGLFRCPSAEDPRQGCLRTHGAMRLYDGRLFAATGEGPLVALDPATGETLARYDVRLPGNHIMEFAIDEVERRVYVVGSCNYARGLAFVDLRGGTTYVLAAPGRAESPCGERISVTPDGSRLVIAQTASSPAAGSNGRLLILTEAGIPLREIHMSAEPIDILVVPAL